MENLTAVNVKDFNTPDGYAWSADLKLNGKKIGSAHNDGNGGSTNLSITDEAHKEIEAYADVTPEHNQYSFERVEGVIEALVAAVLTKKDEQKIVNKIKRDLKKKVIFYHDANRTGLFESKLPKAATIEGWTHSIRIKYPNAVMLNEMPFAEAFKILVT